MELVSAAKMRKAVNNVLLSRAYAGLSWQTILNIAANTESKLHPLLVKRPVKKIGLVVISSNRGLCGSFNTQILNQTIRYIKDQKENKNVDVELILNGKRCADALAKRNYPIAAEFPKLDVTTKVEEIRAMSRLIIDDYLAGKFDQVVISYTDFISTISQKPRLFQLLPIEIGAAEEFLGQTARATEKNEASSPRSGEASKHLEYLFEPSAEEVLSQILPRLIEVKIYQAILESDASEHSARMMSMQNASMAASDMIDALTLAFNQARQAAITTELADISGGRAALE